MNKSNVYREHVNRRDGAMEKVKQVVYQYGDAMRTIAANFLSKNSGVVPATVRVDRELES